MNELRNESHAAVTECDVTAFGMLGIHLADVAKRAVRRMDRSKAGHGIDFPGGRTAVNVYERGRQIARSDREFLRAIGTYTGARNDADPGLAAEHAAVFAEKHRVRQPIGHVGRAGG